MGSSSNIEKFELYILSLWLLFFLVIVVTIDVGIFEDAEPGVFIGWMELVVGNIIRDCSIFCVKVKTPHLSDHRSSAPSSLPSKNIASCDSVRFQF